MGIYFYYIILAVIIICFLKKLCSKSNFNFIISDVFWVVTPWLISLSLYYFSGITYQYNLSIYSFSYIVLFWIMYFLGRFLGLRIKVNSNFIQNDQINVKNNNKIDLKLMYIISILSTLVYIIYMLSRNKIVFGVTREFNNNMFGTLLLFFSESSLILWLYELAYSLLNDTKINKLAYLAAIMYVVPSLLISGRDAIIILLITTLIVFIYCGKFGINVNNTSGKFFKKVKKFLYLGILLLLYYFIFLSQNRYGSDMIKLFEWSTKSTFSKELLNIVFIFKGFGLILLNAIYYYSSQFTKLAWIYDNYNGPYIYGFFQLHFISRRLPESWGLNYINCVNSAKKMMTAQGYEGLSNMWGTVIQYFIYDFGRIGSIIMAFLFGIWIGRWRKHFNKNKDILSILMQVMICVAMFITIQFSPIYDLNWLFPLIWLIILKKGIKQKSKK